MHVKRSDVVDFELFLPAADHALGMLLEELLADRRPVPASRFPGCLLFFDFVHALLSARLIEAGELNARYADLIRHCGVIELEKLPCPIRHGALKATQWITALWTHHSAGIHRIKLLRRMRAVT